MPLSTSAFRHSEGMSDCSSSAAPVRRPLVVANWKMHGRTTQVAAFVAAWQDGPADVDVVLCPPLAYLGLLVTALRGRRVRFGAQNVWVASTGAFTGEHAAEMARDLGADFAIVGHSERRDQFSEADALVAAKFQAAKRGGLTPILCVGETAPQRSSGAAVRAVLKQLDAVVESAGYDAFENAAVAYEPVWAIGTGQTATPSQVQEMHAAIRAHIAGFSCGDLAPQMRLLYGGSVNPDNAAALFAEQDVDGGLVGGASLDAAQFSAICYAAGYCCPSHR